MIINDNLKVPSIHSPHSARIIRYFYHTQYPISFLLKWRGGKGILRTPWPNSGKICTGHCLLAIKLLPPLHNLILPFQQQKVLNILEVTLFWLVGKMNGPMLVLIFETQLLVCRDYPVFLTNLPSQRTIPCIHPDNFIPAAFFCSNQFTNN